MSVSFYQLATLILFITTNLFLLINGLIFCNTDSCLIHVVLTQFTELFHLLSSHTYRNTTVNERNEALQQLHTSKTKFSYLTSYSYLYIKKHFHSSTKT